jgi:ubiquinone/menaquinone biosynthesis C-methylase UbiE
MMDQQEILNKWGIIDQTGKSSEYKNYLNQVTTLEAARLYKQQSFALLRVQPGYHILDVGCGNGDDVRALAQMVGYDGLVVGMDSSALLVEGATNSDKNSGLPVRYEVGDANNIRYESDAFNGCRADRVF